MTILDGRALERPLTGVGRFVHQVFPHLSVVADGLHPPGYALEPPSGLTLRALGTRTVDAVWNEVALAPALVASGSAYWATNGQVPWRRTPGRIVTTIHDVVHRNREAKMPATLRLSRENAVRASLARADVVTTISHQTSQALERLYGRAADVILPCGPSLTAPDAAATSLARERLDRRCPGLVWVLMVGSPVARKNHVRACAALRRAPGTGLVVVGPPGDPDVEDLLRMSDVPVERVGFVSDAELAAWYAATDVFCYPSLAEGLGLPLLDARALGTRIVTSDREPMRGAAGDLALLCDPLDASDLSRTLLRALNRERPKPEQLTGWTEAGALLRAALEGP